MYKDKTKPLISSVNKNVWHFENKYIRIKKHKKLELYEKV